MIANMLREELRRHPYSSGRLKYDIVVASGFKPLELSQLGEDRAAPDSLVLDAVGGEVGDDIRCRLERMASSLR
jgi:hypothetical protein